jgi:hypothetical protein
MAWASDALACAGASTDTATFALISSAGTLDLAAEFTVVSTALAATLELLSSEFGLGAFAGNAGRGTATGAILGSGVPLKAAAKAGVAVDLASGLGTVPAALPTGLLFTDVVWTLVSSSEASIVNKSTSVLASGVPH